MKKHLDVIMLGAAILLMVVMLALLAAPGLTTTLLGETEHTSLATLINPEGDTLGVGGIIAALIFTLVALCVTRGLLALKLLNKDKGFGGVIALGAAGLMLMVGLMFFCTKSLYVDWFAKMNGISREASEDLASNTTLGAGAIVNGIFGFLSGGLLATFGFLKIKK